MIDHCIDLIDRLAAASVRQAVICPGSRSTPLSLAAEHHPDIATHVVIDERSAGYFALGISKATGLPVAVITTSGTAVANLLPACIEAHQSNTPLVLLTADRPSELRHTGANQTMDQPGLFERFTRRSIDAPHPGEADLSVLDEVLAAMVAWPPGPVHINQPLREPLAPDSQGQSLLAELQSRPRRPQPEPIAPGPDGPIPEAPEGNGIIVCGPGAGPLDIEGVVLADGLSGTSGLTAYDEYLDRAPSPDWVLQFGATPTSRRLHTYLAGLGAPRFKVDASGRRWDDIPGATIIECRPQALLDAWQLRPDTNWMHAWNTLERQSRTEQDTRLAAAPDSEAAWVGGLSDAPRLFVGNSMPVRYLDRYGRDLPEVFANRGVSGIDGTIATAAGIATDGPLVAVIGDVAFQHDVGSLALMPDAMRLIVIDNGGGRIFEHLAIKDATQHFERLFLTPPSVDIEAAAEAFGKSVTGTTPSGLPAALATDAQVIVVRPAR